MRYRRPTRSSDACGKIYAGGVPLSCKREADGYTYVEAPDRSNVKVDLPRIGFAPAPVPAPVEVVPDTEEAPLLSDAVAVPARRLIDAIADGQFDFDLEALAIAESDHRSRGSVLRAIDARLDAIVIEG